MSWTWGLYLLLALAALSISALLAWAHLRFWSRRLTLSLDYALTEELTTADGATIALRRMPVSAGAVPVPELPPVLLVHGLGANHRNQDVHPDYSLARYLAALGRDVWLLTLRSGHPARSRKDRARMRFAAMAEQDLPLAITTILERTGQTSLDYVGFSMGGMLAYAALGRSVPVSQVRRVVIVGSPGFVGVSERLRSLLRLVPRAFVPTLPFRFGARLMAFSSEWLKTPLHHLVCNPLNVSPGITRAALMNVIEDVPSALNADILEWAAKDGELRVGGEPVLDGLATIDRPALFVAGTVDRLAPIPAVRRAFDAWAKDRPDTPKRFVVLGRDFGHQENYGHGDLAIGAHVGVELFEPIARFLGPDEQHQEAPGAETGAAAREEIEARAAVPG